MSLVIGKSSRPRRSRACHQCGKRHAGSHRRRSRALKKALAPLGPRPMDLLGESQQVQGKPKGWWRLGSMPSVLEVVQPATKVVSSPEPRVAIAPASMIRRLGTLAADLMRRNLPKRSG